MLCVEDDADIRIIVAMSLGLDPHMNVRVVGSGAAVLELWASDYRPDVVIIDANMPDPTGISLMSTLIENGDTKATTFVILTGAVRPHEVAGFKRAGARAVIPKPFDPLELARSIRRITLNTMDR